MARFPQGIAHPYPILCSSQMILHSYDLAYGTSGAKTSNGSLGSLKSSFSFFFVGDSLGKSYHPLCAWFYLQGHILGLSHSKVCPTNLYKITWRTRPRSWAARHKTNCRMNGKKSPYKGSEKKFELV